MAVVPAAIEARELYRFYHIGDEETLALRGVSLAVNAGEMVAVVGPSGSGKSTLLACLAGLDEPDGGFVYVNGERLTRRDQKSRTLHAGATYRVAFAERQSVRSSDRAPKRGAKDEFRWAERRRADRRSTRTGGALDPPKRLSFTASLALKKLDLHDIA